MEIQKADDMVTHIRAIMEQSQNPEELVAMNDVKTLALEELIANCLEQAVAMAVDNADESLFETLDVKIFSKVSATEDATEDDDADDDTEEINDDGTITAPADLQRMILISADSWTGVVRQIYDQSSPLYRICNNKYIKSAGVNDRPAAFYDFNDSGKKVIKLYPDATQSAKMVYISRPELKKVTPATGSSYQGIACDKLLYEGACFYCAFLVAMTQGWANATYYRQEAVQALRAQVVNAAATSASVSE